MPLSILAKVIIIFVAAAAIGGITTTVILLGGDDEAPVTTPYPDTTTAAPTTEPPTTPTTEPVPTYYDVGVGIADMTGPCVEIRFMGYAELSQQGGGLHSRQFSRAFIFVQGGRRLVLVSAEVQAIGIAVRRQVVANLQELYGDLYTLDNVILTGTHTHSAPGGHLVDFILDISILGFSSATYNAYVDGITRSIINAHESIVPARLFFSTAEVADVHMNRSPYSYDTNPQEERDRYSNNVDDTLTQIRIEKTDGSLHGVLNWYAVHTTSMNMSNVLVSADNLGYASYLMEKALNPASVAGKPAIVAAFFSANLGDVSPNTRGARCEFSGLECDNQFLLCAAGERCYSVGPGEDMFESTMIVGAGVFNAALEALQESGEELTGELSFVHQFVEMPEQVVSKYDPISRTFNETDQVRGCTAALGYSFASGTIDGANTLNITQGTLESNPLLDGATDFLPILVLPTEEDTECHYPKPILLNTGKMTFPIPWHPNIISATLINIGGVYIAGVPGEPTTMAGRRMRDAISEAADVPSRRVVVSGLTNEYIHYVTTFEEYQVQRYEGASTIFGPHTLDIFLNKFNEFATLIRAGTPTVSPGPVPVDYRNSTRSLITPVLVDNAPLGSSFGDVEQQPPTRARRGDTVSATFIGANPRNDLKQEQTFLLVEQYSRVTDQWVQYATDADWETKFYWERLSTIFGTSRVTIEWTIPLDASITSYRIRYFGASMPLLGSTVRQFEGVTDAIEVVD